jgi:hypothetical protein
MLIRTEKVKNDVLKNQLFYKDKIDLRICTVCFYVSKALLKKVKIFLFFYLF